MITFLFPTRKMDMENLDDLCALRPRGLFQNSRDERVSVNLDTPWLSDGQAQEVLATRLADRLVVRPAVVPPLGQEATFRFVASWHAHLKGLPRRGMEPSSTRSTP